MEHEICYHRMIYVFMIYLSMTQLISLILNSHASKSIFNPLVVYISSSFQVISLYYLIQIMFLYLYFIKKKYSKIYLF